MSTFIFHIPLKCSYNDGRLQGFNICADFEKKKDLHKLNFLQEYDRGNTHEGIRLNRAQAEVIT